MDFKIGTHNNHERPSSDEFTQWHNFPVAVHYKIICLTNYSYQTQKGSHCDSSVTMHISILSSADSCFIATKCHMKKRKHNDLPITER
jgi:hypothetical protein